MSALGDIVHAVPVLAALRGHEPGVDVVWLVEEAYEPVLSLVDGLRQRIVVRASGERGPSPVSGDPPRFARGPAGYLRAAAFLRRQHYDVALVLQGLIKSAVWARVSGARRVIGFSREHLREFGTMKTTIDAAGRLVIPKVLRRGAGLRPGSELEVRWREGLIEIEPAPLLVKLKKRGRFLVAMPDQPIEPLTSETVERTRRQLTRDRGASS